MLWYGNPCHPDVIEAMHDLAIGCIITPWQGNKLPLGVDWCADNGCFGNGYPGDQGFLDWLESHEDKEHCFFAVAPDVVGDAVATLARSAPFFGPIRARGYKVALAAQNGLELLAIPWDDFDVFFIGGDDAWKLGPEAALLVKEAKSRGKWVHMGRVNTKGRLFYADSIGCDSSDGTTLTRGPSKNLRYMLAWLKELEAMSPKPCVACGLPKKPGHPLYCWECWLPRQPMPVQLAECRAARARALLSGHELLRVSAAIFPDGRRWCAGCQRFRRLDVFGKGASRCKPCAWEQSHESTVKRVYGLEAGVYESMMAAQGGKCAICRNRQLMRALAVHHDHVSGAVVALLCASCNHDLLGGAWDSPELLLRAWAVQVRGWPLVERVMASTDPGLGPVGLAWPYRLRMIADELEAMPEPEPVERPEIPPPF